MDEKTIVETLSTPGAVAVAIIWLHTRLKRLEDHQTAISMALGVKLPTRRKKITGTLFALAGLCFIAALSVGGCAGQPLKPIHVHTVIDGTPIDIGYGKHAPTNAAQAELRPPK